MRLRGTAEESGHQAGGVVRSSNAMRSACPPETSGVALAFAASDGHDERDRAAARDHKQRQPFHGLAYESGQVTQIRSTPISSAAIRSLRCPPDRPQGGRRIDRGNLATRVIHGRRVARGGAQRAAALNARRGAGPASLTPGHSRRCYLPVSASTRGASTPWRGRDRVVADAQLVAATQELFSGGVERAYSTYGLP